MPSVAKANWLKLIGLVACLLVGPTNAANKKPSLLELAMKRTSANYRVIGGQAVPFDQNKWQIAVLYSGNANNMVAQFCGGSIISPGWVLTAAHCIDTDYANTYYAVLSGTTSLRHGGKRSKVKAYFVAPNFSRGPDGSSFYHDLALLEIDPNGSQMLGESICLASEAPIPTGQLARVTGWGTTENAFKPTYDLQGANVPIVDNSTCNAAISYDGRVGQSMFCAGLKIGGADACRGDSGGPITTDVDGKRVLLGVVSWGEDCGAPDMYGVYARASADTQWIADTIRLADSTVVRCGK